MGTDSSWDIFPCTARRGVSVQVALIAVSISTVIASVRWPALRPLVDEVIAVMDILFAFRGAAGDHHHGDPGPWPRERDDRHRHVYIPSSLALRGERCSASGSEFVTAAGAGSQPLHDAVKHVLPNSLGPIIAQISISMAFAILAEAALSFFGLGAAADELGPHAPRPLVHAAGLGWGCSPG